MPTPQVGRQLVLAATKNPPMLPGDVAVTNFPLPLRAQEGRVNQDHPANQLASLARNDSRGHPAHRVAHNNRRHQSELALVRSTLEKRSEPHWREFLSLWK